MTSTSDHRGQTCFGRSKQTIKAVSAGIDANGGDAVRHRYAGDLAKKAAESNLITDARGEWLRLCPDCLTRNEELRETASVLHRALEQMHC